MELFRESCLMEMRLLSKGLLLHHFRVCMNSQPRLK
uniref:Uncharacterized protein n=1 Tax=Arundo donax TaxID=35708 RepID=A0A0A9HNQ2_ARUDO